MPSNGIPEQIRIAGEVVRPQLVEFLSQDPVMLSDVKPGLTGEHGTTVQAALFLPEGSEHTDLPAVIVVPGLGGPKAAREFTYGHKLAKAGYAALVIDSFGARGVSNAPDFWRALKVSTWALLADAFEGLRYLNEHPSIDGNTVSIIGFSWGGMVSVLSAYEQIRADFVGDKGLGFASHASYYGCSIPRLQNPTTTGAPLLVLVGQRDENVSLERTRLICEDLERGGSRVDLKVFDAFHQWDGSDEKMRHVAFSLAQYRLTITPDNQLHPESSDTDIDGWLSNTWQLIRNLDLGGYDILRDPELHRRTDALLLEFLDRVSRGKGSGNGGSVPLGAIGAAP